MTLVLPRVPSPRLVVLVLAFLVTTPVWLPSAIGGTVQYHNVLSGSMTGTADRGSLVLVMPQQTYAVGDVVAFAPAYADSYDVTVLHRIIGINENGNYLVRGDVTPGVDIVPPYRVKGKMLMSIPYLGFLTGAARVFPLVGLIVILSLFFVGRGNRVPDPGCDITKGGGYFLIAALVLAIALPLASIGMASNGNKPIAILLIVGLLVTTRLMEVAFPKELNGYVELLYVAVVAAGLSMVYVPGVVDSVRAVFLS